MSVYRNIICGIEAVKEKHKQVFLAYKCTKAITVSEFGR